MLCPAVVGAGTAALAALIIGAWFGYYWGKEAAYEAMGEMFGFEEIQREIAEKGMQ